MFIVMFLSLAPDGAGKGVKSILSIPLALSPAITPPPIGKVVLPFVIILPPVAKDGICENALSINAPAPAAIIIFAGKGISIILDKSLLIASDFSAFKTDNAACLAFCPDNIADSKLFANSF